jgi:putative ABC transport system permease protein
MNLLFKNVLVKVRKSFGRFASLFIIIAVGVGFFAGIRASSPDVVASVDAYYDENNFMDFKIVSSMGLTDDDVNAIKVQDSAGTVIPSYSLDVLCDGKAVRIHAIEDTVNRVTLTEGRMPQSTRECIADSRHYKIGDTVHITDDIAGKLKYSEYTVAGTVKSVLYLFGDYGISNIGDGKLSSFIFVGKENFLSEYYTEIYVTAKRTKNVQLYSGEYESCAALLQNQLLQVKPERETARYEFILNTAAAEIDKAETKLKNEKSKGEKELADAKALLDGNSVKLRDAKSELSSREQSLHAVLTSGREQLAAEEQKLTAGYDEYYANLKKFKAETADAEAKIAAEKEKLSDIAKPEWYIFDRTDAAGYTALKEDTDKVTKASLFSTVPHQQQYFSAP